MTDNRTTELTATDRVRALLKKRGVEWSDASDDDIKHTTWNNTKCWFSEFDDGYTAWGMSMCGTPEQAIVATLGSEPPYDELLHCLENDWHISARWDGLRKFWCIELTEEGVKLRDAMHGTLTAEQVREAIEKRFDFDVWVPKERWQAIAEELNAELGSDNEYEAKMDELLCYLTNGKFSKSRQYSLDFMKACVDEEYEDAYNELNAELGSGKAKDLLLRTFGLAQMMHDCWLEECKAGDNVDVSACNAYSYEFDQIAQAMFDMGTDPNDSDYYRSVELGSGTCKPIEPGRCLDGTDCPAWICSECGELFELGANFCSNCGRKVVSA